MYQRSGRIPGNYDDKLCDNTVICVWISWKGEALSTTNAKKLRTLQKTIRMLRRPRSEDWRGMLWKLARHRKLSLTASPISPSMSQRCWLMPASMLELEMLYYIQSNLTRALLGLWIFHRLLGGGAFERPPPMISAPGRRREKRKAAFESSRKIISKSFRSFFGSGQNWSLKGSKFQNFPKRFFDNKIFNFKDRATNLIPSCLSR